MTAEATEAQVAAAMEALGCVRQELTTREGSAEVVCRKHHAYTPDFKTLLEGEWADRGCPVAVQAADAVVAAGPDPATIAALEAAIDRVRRRHPRGDEEAGTLAPGLWCPGCGQERSRNGYGGCPDRNALTEPRP